LPITAPVTSATVGALGAAADWGGRLWAKAADEKSKDTTVSDKIGFIRIVSLFVGVKLREQLSTASTPLMQLAARNFESGSQIVTVRDGEGFSLSPKKTSNCCKHAVNRSPTMEMAA
jgi:hypothetical protein